jgi:hypothetical protein
MKLQELIKELSFLVAGISDLKMEMITGKLTEKEAKQKSAELIEKSLISDRLTKAIKEWK